MRWDTTVLLFQVSDMSVVFSRAPYSTRGKEKASWKSPPNEANTGAKESASIPQEKVDYLDGAGKTLDILLGEPKDAPNKEPFGHMDPRTILTLKTCQSFSVIQQEEKRKQAGNRHNEHNF